MNILYLTTHLNIGGISSYLLSLARGLRENGHHIYLASGEGELLPQFIAEGVVYLPIPIRTKQELSPKILFSFFKLLPEIQRYKIDIIHSNTRVTQVLGCFLESATHRPHLYTCHGFFKKRFGRRLFPCWGQKVIAISQEVKEYLLGDFGVKEEKIKLITHGIDLIPQQTFSESPELKIHQKKKLGLGEGQVVGIVARLSPVKGHIYLIQAMKRVLENVPQAQLVIVGEGRIKQKLVDLSERLNLTRSVYFFPNTCNMHQLLSIIDVFVMPSLKEGLGLSLMEAMARGLAVVGSEVGGIKSLIQHRKNGLLVRPADINGLSEAILELLTEPLKAKALGSNGRTFIAENFSWAKMISDTERLYQECLKEKS